MVDVIKILGKIVGQVVFTLKVGHKLLGGSNFTKLTN